MSPLRVRQSRERLADSAADIDLGEPIVGMGDAGQCRPTCGVRHLKAQPLMRSSSMSVWGSGIPRFGESSMTLPATMTTIPGKAGRDWAVWRRPHIRAMNLEPSWRDADLVLENLDGSR